MRSVRGRPGISSGVTLRLIHLLIPSLALALCPQAAGADPESPDYNRSGPYVSLAGIMVTDESLEDERASQARRAVERFNDASPMASQAAPLSSTARTDEAHGGFNARVGYRMHPFFAAEIQTEYVAGFSARITIEDSTGGVAKILNRHDLWTTTGNLRLILPFGRVQLFGLGGVGLFHNKSKDRRFRFVDPITSLEVNEDFGDETGVEAAVRTGGGVDFYATEHVVLSVEASYVIPFGRFDHLDYLSLSVGAAYRF